VCDVYRVNGANKKSSVVARDFRPPDELSPTNTRAHIGSDDDRSKSIYRRAAVYHKLQYYPIYIDTIMVIYIPSVNIIHTDTIWKIGKCAEKKKKSRGFRFDEENIFKRHTTWAIERLRTLYTFGRTIENIWKWQRTYHLRRPEKTQKKNTIENELSCNVAIYLITYYLLSDKYSWKKSHVI